MRRCPKPTQPALVRLENVPPKSELTRKGLKLIYLCCDSFHSVPGRIILDIDNTVDRAYREQQLSLFNPHAGGYCFQPIPIQRSAVSPVTHSLATKFRRCI
ncbi:transposase [uncultured Cohaesibacter sp.]|uniref:transposase n=1 Tax=uncultured Cohaesibacter sp. TaxID=1002546 RepID=UPI003749AB3F